jgi:hypothetical protein
MVVTFSILSFAPVVVIDVVDDSLVDVTEVLRVMVGVIDCVLNAWRWWSAMC